MGEIKLFQVCYEGELTVAVSDAMRRLGAEPNFDQSWNVWLPEGGHAELLVRYLRIEVGDEARVLIGCSQFTSTRDFLLIRHSLTPGADYSELHDAIARLGVVVDLPFESTFVVQSDDRTDVRRSAWPSASSVPTTRSSSPASATTGRTATADDEPDVRGRAGAEEHSVPDVLSGDRPHSPQRHEGSRKESL